MEKIEIFPFFANFLKIGFASKANVLHFWPEMGSMLFRKMALVGKFHKTRGSHIDFLSGRTICDDKKIIWNAAHPGIFLKAKKTRILMFYFSKFTV